VRAWGVSRCGQDRIWQRRDTDTTVREVASNKRPGRQRRKWAATYRKLSQEYQKAYQGLLTEEQKKQLNARPNIRILPVPRGVQPIPREISPRQIKPLPKQNR